MAEREPWRTVWITGASTGLGREMAVQLARHGVKVAVSARSEEKLKSLAKEVANVFPYPLNVTDVSSLEQAVQDIEKNLGPIDLAVFNAGTYEPQPAEQMDHASFHHIMAVNYSGAVSGVIAVLGPMRNRAAGHIAIVASVAGYRGLPNAGAYGSTKAALINFAESIKTEIERDGIITSVINPGFIDTPMTQKNDFPMPFLMDVEQAAKTTIAGLRAGKFEVAYPMKLVLILKLMRILPYWLYFALIERFVLRK
ncbi:MAG: SDR family NAD(P)-dependent oxidoreductase [Hyphomicrobiales bacterium]